MATPSSQIAAELWPQILRRLERWQRNVGTGGGSGGTVTVEFTGTVTDDQAPQFLLRDGSRSLQGNLAVDTGVTIDGVDISAHAADSSAHHAPVTAGDGIGVTGQSVAVNSTVVRTTRTVSAGDGLSGGGDLSANRSFAVDSTVVRTTRNLVAGSGLTGGGTLASDRTFNVGAGDGIAVAADSVAVSLATDPGLEFSTGSLRAKVTTGITRGAAGLAVDQGFAPTWTGAHTFNAQPVVNNNLRFTGARTINSDSTNALTLAPGGELVLDPGDTVTLAAGTEFRTATFSDLVTGIGGARLWDRGSNAYQMTIGGLKADELFARVFVADETRINRGEEFWSKSYGIVETAFVLPAIDGLVNVWFEDSPGLASADLFATGDWLLARTVDWATGLVLSAVWFLVDVKISASTGRQNWRLRRKSGGTDGQTIKAGSVALDVGQSGQGWVHINALDSGSGPFVQVGTWSGSDPYTPANVINRVRMGHLSGAAGFSTGDYGFAAGNNLGLTPATGFEGFVAEATDGAALYNTDVDLYESGTLRASLRPATGLRFFPDTANQNYTNVDWYDGSANVKAHASGYWTSGTASTLDLAALAHSTEGAYLSARAVKSTLNSGFFAQVLNAGTTAAQIAGEEITLDTTTTGGGTVYYTELTQSGQYWPAVMPLGVNLSPGTTAQVDVLSGAAGRHALRLRSAASPTVATLDVENNGGGTVFAVDDSGIIAPVTARNTGNGTTVFRRGNNGHELHWAHTGLAGTQTIIAGSGTTSVYGVLGGSFAVQEFSGGSPTSNVATGAISLTPGATQTLCNFTGRTCVLAVDGITGAATIYRGAGDRTYRVSLSLIWV